MHFAHQFWGDTPREEKVGGRVQETVEGDQGEGVWAVACLSHSVGVPKRAPERGAC